MKSMYVLDYSKSDLTFYQPFIEGVGKSIEARDYNKWINHLDLYQFVGVNRSDKKFKLLYKAQYEQDIFFDLPALVRFKYTRRNRYYETKSDSTRYRWSNIR